MSETLVLLVALAFWIGLLTLVALVLRARRGRPSPRDLELEDLRARYASGDLSPQDYERRRQELALRE
jgi:uncharacterized membrane protein